MTRTALLLAATAITLLALVASGCGSSGSDKDGVAALETGASTGSEGGTTTDQETDEDPQEAALKWARCMREHGVDVPDPEVSSDGRVTVRPRVGTNVDRNNDKFQEAERACGSPLGNAQPQLTEAQREELQETMLAFAKCMREHGIDFPDPHFSGGGGAFRIGPGAKFDPNDPDFQKAQKACEPILQELQDARTKGPKAAR
jgi:hypothetical protein